MTDDEIPIGDYLAAWMAVRRRARHTIEEEAKRHGRIRLETWAAYDAAVLSVAAAQAHRVSDELGAANEPLPPVAEADTETTDPGVP